MSFEGRNQNRKTIESNRPSVLADLFGSKGANAVQAKAENQAILLPQAYIEGGELGRNRTAIPTIPQRYS
jgi:hypothetical protein